MSWVHYTEPKGAAGELLTTKDVGELWAAFIERLAVTTSDAVSAGEPPLVSSVIDYTRAGSQVIQDLAEAIAELSGFFSHTTIGGSATQIRYSPFSSAYKSDRDILYQAALDLGYSGAVIDEIHPDTDVLRTGGLRTVQYFDICRKALQLMTFRTIVVGSPNRTKYVTDSGGEPTWQDAKDAYEAAAEAELTTSAGALVLAQSTLSGGSGDYFITGVRVEYEVVEIPAELHARMTRIYIRSVITAPGTNLSRFPVNLIVDGDTGNPVAIPGTDTHDIEFDLPDKGSGNVSYELEFDAYTDVEVYEEPFLDGSGNAQDWAQEIGNAQWIHIDLGFDYAADVA